MKGLKILKEIRKFKYEALRYFIAKVGLNEHMGPL